jgi:hypothetical protein
MQWPVALARHLPLGQCLLLLPLLLLLLLELHGQVGQV